MSDIQRQEEKQNKQAQEQNSGKKTAPSGGCPSCGHINPADARFCEECGNPLGGIICPNCQASVPPGGDICEACGTWLLEGQCAFCQANLSPDDAFCGECGNPAGGISCPDCGTLSFFDYCRKCHKKLTELADEMMKAIQDEPEVKVFLEQKQEYSDNLAEIKKLEKELEDNKPQQPAYDQSSADAMAAMMKKRKTRRPTGVKKTESPPGTDPKQPEVVQVNTGLSQDVIEERKKKLQALKNKQSALEKKLSRPPEPLNMETATNQQIRRYFMALKPPIVKGWLCNAFQCLHQDPMHCTKPTGGGRWVC